MATVSSEDIDQYLAPIDPPRSSSPPVASSSRSGAVPPTSPSAPQKRSAASSSPLDPDDPDFVGPRSAKVSKKKSDEITLTLNTKKWIKDLSPHRVRGKWTPADVFRFCASTIISGNGDLSSVPLSQETIRKILIATEQETAKQIRVRLRVNNCF